jgi:hypothetical protein
MLALYIKDVVCFPRRPQPRTHFHSCLHREARNALRVRAGGARRNSKCCSDHSAACSIHDAEAESFFDQRGEGLWPHDNGEARGKSASGDTADNSGAEGSSSSCASSCAVDAD